MLAVHVVGEAGRATNLALDGERGFAADAHACALEEGVTQDLAEAHSSLHCASSNPGASRLAPGPRDPGEGAPASRNRFQVVPERVVPVVLPLREPLEPVPGWFRTTSKGGLVPGFWNHLCRVPEPIMEPP